jgi:hypothetical protein
MSVSQDRHFLSINGKISQRQFDGEYAVNGNCTRTAVFAFSDREQVNTEAKPNT